MNPQEVATAYGRALVRQHLQGFELVFSAGPYCRAAFHLRRLFDQEQAFPFDWWVTPASSMLRMLQPDFRFQLTPGQIFLTEAAQVVLNSADQILHLHDFRRTATGEISLSDLELQLEQINGKYGFLFERLRQRLQAANRCLVVVEGLMPAAELESYRQRTGCPELTYPPLQHDFASVLVAMLRDAYQVDATLVCFNLGAPAIEQQDQLLLITAPYLASPFDQEAESWQRPWASYNLLIELLCSAVQSRSALSTG